MVKSQNGEGGNTMFLSALVRVAMGLNVSHCDENGERTPCHHDVKFKFGKDRNTCSLVVALWPVGCLVRTGTGAGTAVQVLAAEYGHF